MLQSWVFFLKDDSENITKNWSKNAQLINCLSNKNEPKDCGKINIIVAFFIIGQFLVNVFNDKKLKKYKFLSIQKKETI